MATTNNPQAQAPCRPPTDIRFKRKYSWRNDRSGNSHGRLPLDERPDNSVLIQRHFGPAGEDGMRRWFLGFSFHGRANAGQLWAGR